MDRVFNQSEDIDKACNVADSKSERVYIYHTDQSSSYYSWKTTAQMFEAINEEVYLIDYNI